MDDVETVLKDLLSKGPSEIDISVATQQLQQCFSVLRRETAFKVTAPGESAPLLPYDLVDAKDAIENAIQKLGSQDLNAALDRIRSALSAVQAALRRTNPRRRA